MKIAICALTCERPDGLTRLLKGLNDLTFGDPPPQVTLVIVDNDPAGSAGCICERFAQELRWPLEYVVEPHRGIAPARNAALENVGDADWVCFIDDDEVPSATWLDELIRVQREYDADVVAGPVVPHFSEPVPDWILRGRFFERRRYPTGRRLPHAFTHNVLFRRRILDEMNLRFDTRWALTGGEDRHFFQQISMKGYRIVWADRAVVTEWIPGSRANAAWLVRRHYRVGNTTSLIERALRPAWSILPLLASKSLAWLAIGVGLLALTPFRGRHVRVQGQRACAYGAGLLTGMFGLPFEEYRRTHRV
ncbi:MAG: glycosyltransferase family 2 protein [Phycisphaerales bacterium]|nr:MAG: glycosyltransferase family 2 protein [Phycisphaerales bacterium]